MIETVLGFLTKIVGGPVLIGLVVGLLVGVGGGLAWEHRPANWPNYQLNLLFFHPRIGFGDGLAAQRDAARAELAPAVANELALAKALKAQSAAVEALYRQGAYWRGQAESAIADYQAASAAASKRRPILQAPITGADACSRVEDFDKRFLETLQ